MIVVVAKAKNCQDSLDCCLSLCLIFALGDPYWLSVHLKYTPAMHHCNRAISLYHKCLPSLCLENHDAVMREGVREREEERSRRAIEERFVSR